RGVANKSRTIRIPVHVVEREQKVARTERELLAKLGYEPSVEEIAKVSKLPVTQVREVKNAAKAVASTDAPIGSDGDSSFGDLFAAAGPTTEDEVDQTMRTDAVRRAVAKLPERQRSVISLRFGLSGGEPTSLEQIGKELEHRPGQPEGRRDRGGRGDRQRDRRAVRRGGSPRLRRRPRRGCDDRGGRRRRASGAPSRRRGRPRRPEHPPAAPRSGRRRVR